LSLERTRLLWHFLEGSDYLKNTSILQFAPFKTIENKIKNKVNVNYISGDIDAMLAMKKIDITNIDYPDFSFDVILCSHVLSVVKKDLKAINEMFRVLKPKGTLILQEHIFEEFETTFEDFTIKTDNERYNTYGKHYLQRCYGKDFTERFIDIGFSVCIYDPKKELSEEKIKKNGIQNSGIIHLFTKN
jgi:ubiquinone/menaquinone biosynthesis C-methylase UbiE